MPSRRDGRDLRRPQEVTFGGHDEKRELQGETLC